MINNINHRISNSEEMDKEKNSFKNVAGNDKLKRITKIFSNYKVPTRKNKEEAWGDLYAKIQESERKTNITRNIRIFQKIVYPLAASILLVLIIYTFYEYSKIEVLVPRGQQQAVLLPDSSEVFLNADSKLSYSRLNWKNNRRIKFEGEAFFNVKKEGRFEVICNSGVISVTGTSFNVFSRMNKLEVKCFTGKIEVAAFDNTPVLLNEKEAIKYSDDIKKFPDAYKFNSESAPSWRTGEYHFSRSPLRSVFEELERQYDIKVHYPETGNRTYTGFFKNENLKQALDMICIPMSLEYNIINDDTVMIK